MEASKSTDGGGSVEVSEELLRLLRAINEKFDSGNMPMGREAMVASKATSRPRKELWEFRWYENTLPGQFWVGELS
jgi:hypothetical protein